MASNILLITGPPGSSKTTGYVESLAKDTPGSVAVFEPVQKIVIQKQEGIKIVQNGKLSNLNIRYINYAQGLSTDFYIKSLSELAKYDKIVIDEAHTLFFTEFRDFDVKTIDEMIELYSDRLIFITATPEILELYLKMKEVQYTKVEFPQRLKRKKFNIRIIPAKFSTFIKKDTLDKYDITLVNNIKTIKKLQKLVGEKNREYSFIYSYYNEINNLYFKKETVNDNKWIGTSSLGQGIDKFVTLKKDVGNVLFDGNSYRQIPDLVKKRYYAESEDDVDYYHAVFKCMTQNIIQTDRFRIDLDELNIDIVFDIQMEYLEPFKKILIEGFNGVYTNCDIEVTFGDALYANKLDNFGYKDFVKCLGEYNYNHKHNTKHKRTRFLELLNILCNPVKDDDNDKRTKCIGMFKTTLKYFNDIYEKFYDDEIEERELTIFNNILERRRRNTLLQKGMTEFVNMLIEEDIKTKALNYIIVKEDEFGVKKEEPQKELYTDLGYLGESLLQILFAHYDIRYSVMGEDKREGSPIQLLPKYLRYLVLIKDVDISGCHVVAMIKKIMGDDYAITTKLINKIYSYGTIAKQEMLEYLHSFGYLKSKTLQEIEDGYKTERGICKQAILSGINKLDKYKQDKDYVFVKRMLRNGIENMNDIDLKTYGQLGYHNGIKYEQKWLGQYTNHRGVIFRIADGLGQAYGNKEFLEDIKQLIMKEHKIMIVDENIEKYNMLGMTKNLDYFVQKIGKELKDVEITDDMVEESFYDCVNALERFRVYLRKDKYKGKLKGKGVGKAKHRKKYIVLSFNIKNLKMKKERKKVIEDVMHNFENVKCLIMMDNFYVIEMFEEEGLMAMNYCLLEDDAMHVFPTLYIPKGKYITDWITKNKELPKDINVDIVYHKGLYSWKEIPKNIPKNYRQRYLNKTL